MELCESGELQLEALQIHVPAGLTGSETVVSYRALLVSEDPFGKLKA